MPLSAEQKAILKERMAKAREAKQAKKAKIAEIIEKPKEAEPAAPAPAPVPVAVQIIPPSEQPKPNRSKPIKIPKQVVDEDTSITPSTPKAQAGKSKYAKLVFYQEPGNNKKIKKLTKVLEESSSDDEAPVETPKVAQVAEPPKPQVDEAQQRYQKLAKMSRLFFD